MGSLIGWLVGKQIFGAVIGAKAARIIAIAGLFLALLGIFGLGKCTYDRAVISRHEAKQEAANAKADRKADERAADQRFDDIARANEEAQEIKEAVNEARNEGRDPRAEYYRCVKLQQAARRQHQPPAKC